MQRYILFCVCVALFLAGVGIVEYVYRDCDVRNDYCG